MQNDNIKTFNDATTAEIDSVMNKAWEAFREYRTYPLRDRATFMRAIAVELERGSDVLVATANRETNIPPARLHGELARTVYQLKSYAEACERGNWLEARIDTANPDKTPPKPDIRKMLIPLGPVVVFGASNFPFAYSTAGGDTACALAAGCPVVVKAHPAHALTSERVAAAILTAASHCGLPDGIFSHVHGSGVEVGKALVLHPHTRAVGFTGSTSGGKQLFEWGNQRTAPIPVFAEMGSINPVFLLPRKLAQSAPELAKTYAASITLGVGQFCTNPGLIIGIESESLQQFITLLGQEIEQVTPAKMLHLGIAKAFAEKRLAALSQPGVNSIATSLTAAKGIEGLPTIASATGREFLGNPVLHQEVFGPYSIVIRCTDVSEMKKVAMQLEGQLTATLMATDEDLQINDDLIAEIQPICGRFILNGVPTGVDVCLSMQHGGPYPATTDARFTAVGADGIKRFARPIAFQHWEDRFLPPALQNDNPLGIWRTINNELTRETVSAVVNIK